MAHEHNKMVSRAERQVRDFASAVSDLRSVPLLTQRAVSQARHGCGNDAAAARRNLLSLYQRTPPHELGLPSDEYITGKVGGLAPKRIRSSRTGEQRGRSADGRSTLQLLTPATRPIRLTNAYGETSFHFSFEVVTKNHTQFGLQTKSGRRARPDEHGKYLEDEEKRAHEMAATPVDPESFAHYQEREHALAVVDEGYLFTSIEGEQTDRLDLFRAGGEFERSNRPPSMTVDVGTQTDLVSRFFERAWDNEALSQAMVRSGSAMLSAAAKGKGTQMSSSELFKIKFEGHDAVAAHELLHELGWREHHQNPKDFRSHGVQWDTGKSGRIQMRAVGEIPHEIGRAGRRRFLQAIAGRFDELGVPYVLVMHRPTAENNQKNWHFHLVYWDRPAERFNPKVVRKQLQSSGAHAKRYSKRNLNFQNAALQDPIVQAQAGRWDFEVEYNYVDKKGRSHTIFPFKQNKNRECKRESFVPELRQFLADIANRELAKAGVKRRVRAEKNTEFGIDKEPGIHLCDSANREELCGRPTPGGAANEKKQWNYIQRTLDKQYEREKESITELWVEMSRDYSLAGFHKSDINRVSTEWISLKLAEIKLRDQSRRAQQVADRLFSRPNAIADESYNHLEAILNGTASRKVRSARSFHLERLKVLREHSSSLQQLFRHELRLQIEIEAQADELAKQARKLLDREGLNREALFPCAEEKSHATSKPEHRLGQAPVWSPDGSKPQTGGGMDPAATGTSQHLKTIATKRVPFVLVTTWQDSGARCVTAEIAPLDQARYRLPAKVAAVTNHEISRLEGMHRAQLAREGQRQSGSDRPVSPVSVAVQQERPVPGTQAAGDPSEDETKKRSRRSASVAEPAAASETKPHAAKPGAPERSCSAQASPERTMGQPTNVITDSTAAVEKPLASDTLQTPTEVQGVTTISQSPRVETQVEARDEGVRTEVTAKVPLADVAPGAFQTIGQTAARNSHEDRSMVQLLERAKQREVILFIDVNGDLTVRDAHSRNSMMKVETVLPDMHEKLLKLEELRNNELGRIGQFVARNSSQFRASNWRDALARSEVGREYAQMLDRWSNNVDFQRTLSRCIALPTPDRADDDDQHQRRFLFAQLLLNHPDAEELAQLIEERSLRPLSSSRRSGLAPIAAPAVAGKPTPAHADTDAAWGQRSGVRGLQELVTQGITDTAPNAAGINPVAVAPTENIKCSAQEERAARAFIARLGDKAIHVGADGDGLILPQPVYWASNGLTKQGLSDPGVQAALERMEQRQADFMKHIHPMLRDTVTADLLVRGSPAVVAALPEVEQKEASAWAGTGVWPKLMSWVKEEGEQCSRRELRRWLKARDKCDGSHLAQASKVEAQLSRWPIDLAPAIQRSLSEDARRHYQNLAAQQVAARQGGID